MSESERCPICNESLGRCACNPDSIDVIEKLVTINSELRQHLAESQRREQEAARVVGEVAIERDELRKVINVIQEQRDELRSCCADFRQDALRFGMVRDILKSHGCMSNEECVHIPSLVEKFLGDLEADRDRWRTCVKWMVDEVCKNSDGLDVCQSNECGGCENDDTPPCEELCRDLVHQLERVPAAAGPDRADRRVDRRRCLLADDRPEDHPGRQVAERPR